MLTRVPSTTNHAMFEALFDRRLRPTGEFADELRAAGYDAARAVPKYPTELWVRCLEIARRQRWAALPIDEAYRHIGREFTHGFLETLTGRLVGVAIPFMTPKTFLRRLASYMRMGRNDDGLTFDLVNEQSSSVDAQVHNPAGVPGGFVAGMIDVAMDKLKVSWTITIDQKTPLDYVLHVEWKMRP